MDGGVVQVIPVGRSLDKEGVSRLVFEASWDYVGPIIVSYIVTNDKIQDRTNHSSGVSRDIAFVTLAEAVRVTVSPESSLRDSTGRGCMKACRTDDSRNVTRSEL